MQNTLNNTSALSNVMQAVFPATAEQVLAERAAIIAGIVARKSWEHANKTPGSDALASIISTLNKHIKAVEKLDSFTLGYVHHNPLIKNVSDDGNVEHVSYADIYTSQRRASQCFNEKAIPKVYACARVLNGGVFYCKGNDDETLAGVVLALSRGITNGKLIKNALCDYMNRAGAGRGTWQSQDTQGSSSLRALEALGVVTRVDGKGTEWKIADTTRFARLLAGAKGERYVAPVSVESPACDVPDAPDSVSADALADALAIVQASEMPAPASVHDFIAALALPAYDAQALLTAPRDDDDATIEAEMAEIIRQAYLAE